MWVKKAFSCWSVGTSVQNRHTKRMCCNFYFFYFLSVINTPDLCLKISRDASKELIINTVAHSFTWLHDQKVAWVIFFFFLLCIDKQNICIFIRIFFFFFFHTYLITQSQQVSRKFRCKSKNFYFQSIFKKYFSLSNNKFVTSFEHK